MSGRGNRKQTDTIWLVVVATLFTRCSNVVGWTSQLPHTPFTLQSATKLSASWNPSNDKIAREISMPAHKQVQSYLDQVFGTRESEVWNKRRQAAITLSLTADSVTQHERVYGELGLDAVVTILDAVGVRKDDVFLDIGSGDGLVVASASLLYPNLLTISRGIEVLPSLYERSVQHSNELKRLCSTSKESQPSICPVELILGNINNAVYDQNQVHDIVRETTLAVCFATTWSRGNEGRRLPKLSEALEFMPVGGRVVVVDGVLTSPVLENYGELRLHCPDTAPYSTARLYVRKR